MTTIHLIGSEGFIGRALQRIVPDIDLHCWSHQLSDPHHHFDLLNPSSWQKLLERRPTHVILLSWPGLPNYQDTFHITRNLPACAGLIEQLAENNLQRILVAGTCYEYGLQNGSLKEELPSDPVNCYAIAKDSLRRLLQNYYQQRSLQWCWLRIFYPFGEEQNPESLFPSLIQAIKSGNKSFPISSGKQIRDFIPVDDVARQILELLKNQNVSGIYNCGSGIPSSIYDFVQHTATTFGSNIDILRGAHPGRSDEPFASWADMNKYKTLVSKGFCPN